MDHEICRHGALIHPKAAPCHYCLEVADSISAERRAIAALVRESAKDFMGRGVQSRNAVVVRHYMNQLADRIQQRGVK